MAKLKKCTQCESEFYGSANAMYCSNACKQKGYRGRNSEGVLYLLFKDGDVVYVGKSTCESGVKGRLSCHSSSSSWDSDKDFDSYEISHKFNDVTKAECDYIAKLEPKYNKKMSSSSTYITKRVLVKEMQCAISEYVDSHVDLINVGNGYIHKDRVLCEIKKLKNKLKK